MENILFIFTDQWKADCVGYRGHDIVKTPYLDKLHKKSVDFVNSFTVCPLCTPTRGSMFTGLYPHQSGVIDNCDVGASLQEFLPNSAYTWLDAMIDADYKVGHFGKWHLGLDWQEGKNLDFDLMRIESDREKHNSRVAIAAVTERGQLNPAWKGNKRPKLTEDYKPATKRDDFRTPFYGKLDSIEERFEHRVVERSKKFMMDNQQDPWCLTVSLVGPHFPNLLPEPFFSMYDNADIAMPANMYDKFANKPWFQSRNWWPTTNADSFDEAEWRKAICAYYGSITLMDFFIGQLLDTASACSGGRKTRVIFTSDHGEMIGAHSRFDKAAYMYEEVIRTPLLICNDLEGAENASISEGYVGTLDIAATFFDLAGKPSPNGVSLINHDTGETVMFSNYYKYNGHSFEIRSVTTPRYKYSFIPQDIDELYDLELDPHELVNLSDNLNYAHIKESLKQLVLDNMKATSDYLLDIIEDLPPAGCLSGPDYPDLKLVY